MCNQWQPNQSIKSPGGEEYFLTDIGEIENPPRQSGTAILGSGGFAYTYLATRFSTSQTEYVAIKVLKNELRQEADLTCKPSHEKGLVITQSWTLSATLIYNDGDHGDNSHKMPQITVPLDRLILKENQETGESNKYANILVEESFYDQENTQWKTRTLRWGCAYQKNIIITINNSQKGANFFDGFPDYEYKPRLGFVDLPRVFVKWKPKNFEQQLAYKDRDKTIAVINYITSNNG